jgi:predicted RNase H-like nuclease
MTRRPRPASRGSGPTVVLGVDGCPAGWVGALLAGDRVTLHVAARIDLLVDGLDVVPDVVGIDMPIGLPDAGSREADRLARTRLPVGRKSSVFPTPARAAVLADTWPEANATNREATGKGLSHQGFNLCRKVAEVDAWLHGDPGVRVVEIHPEVSFAAMGADTTASKKTAAGRDERLRVLGAQDWVLPDLGRTPSYAVDDALDACAVAWSALRVARGEAWSLPDPPEVFSDGLEAAIRV